jgi:hypothetical protein
LFPTYRRTSRPVDQVADPDDRPLRGLPLDLPLAQAQVPELASRDQPELSVCRAVKFQQHLMHFKGDL